MTQRTLYFDADGTLAEWVTAATFAELKKPGYFYNLKPLETVGVVRALAGTGAEVYVVTAYLPDCDALQDKTRWFDEFLPEVDYAHRIFVPYGTDKARYVEDVLGRDLSEDDWLIDDHSPNLISWTEAGGVGVKWLNGINGKQGTFKGYRTGSPDELYSLLSA